ncbi:MAG: glutamyl-tRNA reductase [Thermodesulfobacteriota bacterium]
MDETKPDTIILTGVNHRSAPVTIREKLAFSDDEVLAALDALIALPPVHEVILFSTCNRVEVLFATDDAHAAGDAVVSAVCNMKSISPDELTPVLYHHEKDAAVRHLFRVASGLDSMVMGEPQIFGQVKKAYRQALNRGTSGVILNRLIHRTFFVAKRVRSETGIGDSAVSISYAAIELARKIFGSLEGRRVLLVGAGEMAELAVEHLAGNRAGTIWVANRTLERAVALARAFHGTAVSFDEIPGLLAQADIVISSTGAPGLVITRDQVKAVMRSRKNRPLFFIDIAVPRDIDPDINKLENAFVYDIDDLQGIVDGNMEERRKEAIRAERIVDESVIQFRSWYDSLDVVPTVVSLREKMSAIARSETEKTLATLKGLDSSDREAVIRMTDAIVSKIMHDPTGFLKGRTDRKSKHQYLDMVRRLFNLDE